MIFRPLAFDRLPEAWRETLRRKKSVKKIRRMVESMENAAHAELGSDDAYVADRMELVTEYIQGGDGFEKSAAIETMDRLTAILATPITEAATKASLAKSVELIIAVFWAKIEYHERGTDL